MTGALRPRIHQALRSTRIRPVLRVVVSVGVLVGVIAHVGTGPVLHGFRSLDPQTIAVALVLGAIATVAAAWRWRLVAARLGLDLGWSSAIAMYYRSQFLNTVLPGGIVGDVHRAASAGRIQDDVRTSARSVAIERTAGQAVQVTLAVGILACVGAEFEGYLLVAVAIGIAAIAISLGLTVSASARARAVLLREGRELRAGLGSVRTSVRVIAASLIVVACHVATLTVATAAVGAGVPPLSMLALALVVLLGASIPVNLGGWGPREGVAGWAFAVAGFGASAGVSASTLFGVLAMISVAPGAVIAVSSALRRRTSAGPDPTALPAPLPVLELVPTATTQENTP